MKSRSRAGLLALGGAAAAASSAFLLGCTAWPEIATPAWFVTRGLVLYDAIFFPHTPLLILLTAAFGGAFGFSAAVLRAVPALALAASGALVVLGTRRHRASAWGPVTGLLAGVPLLLLLTVYTEGPALWPEPFLVPLALAGVLLLERVEHGAGRHVVFAAGVAFGAGILVKQTFAWCALGAFLWLALHGPRRRRHAAAFAAAVALPYAAFALGWALAFRTLAHVRWTLIFPLFSGMSSEIAMPADGADLREAAFLLLAFPALDLLARALPGPRQSSPAAAVAVACLGMAWPRWGLLHLAGMTGVAALVGARAVLVAAPAIRRGFRRAAPRGTLVTATLGGGALAAFLAVALLGAGPLLGDRVGGPLLFWDDETTRAAAARAAARVPPGGTLFVFGAPHQTLYPLTRTDAPGRLYVNPSFWYCLNKGGVEARLVAALRASPGLPILFREPSVDAARVRETAVYAFVTSETRADGRAGDVEWRVVPEGSR